MDNFYFFLAQNSEIALGLLNQRCKNELCVCERPKRLTENHNRQTNNVMKSDFVACFTPKTLKFYENYVSLSVCLWILWMSDGMVHR